MKNALEQFRQRNGLSYAELARRVGSDRATVMRNCKAARIPPAAAPTYNAKLQIPMKDLLPDLYEGETQS